MSTLHAETIGGQTDLFTGLLPKNAEALRGFVSELLPYLSDIAVTGNLAVRYNVREGGGRIEDRHQDGVSLTVAGSESVSPLLAQETDFLIAHRHPDASPRGFSMTLVEPITALKATITAVRARHRIAKMVPISQIKAVPLISATDQLADTVFDMQDVLRGEKISPLLLIDAVALQKVADPEDAALAWRRLKPTGGPPLDKAFQHVRRAIDETPTLISVTTHPERRQDPYICPHCDWTREFPIAPMDDIKDLLGYVE